MVQLVDFLAAGLTDGSGNVLTGGKVTFFDAGTTTLKTAFQERELTNPLPNPVAPISPAI